MRIGGALAALALAVSAAPPAAASTVSVSGGELTFAASAGEVNDVFVSGDGASLVIDDAGSDVAPGAGCAQDGADVVTCSPQGGATEFSRQTYELGDLSDLLEVASAVPATVRGGDAGDVLGGGPGADTIDGGAGPDVLTGGAGADALLGGEGGDDLRAGGDGSGDDLQGGPGRDRAAYLEFVPVPHVAVSLDGVADDGFTVLGERDNVHADVEDVATGAGDDVVGGSAVANLIDTGDGADTAHGGDGPDGLFGGAGADTLDGGPGNDALAAGRDDDVLRGAAGNDTLDGGGGADLLDGGDGSDTGRFDGTSDPVSVTLNGAADDGRGGEGDNALVENVVTGSGPDAVTGDGSRNLIATGGGDDAVTVSGDAAVDSVGCGAGNDAVTADARDDVAQLGTDDKCELINGRPVEETPPTVRVETPLDDARAPRVSLSRCPPARIRLRTFRRGVACSARPDEPVRMTFTLTATARSARIARAGDVVLAERRTSRSARTRRLRLRPAAGALRGNRSFRARVRITAVDDGGNRTVRTDSFRVRR